MGGAGLLNLFASRFALFDQRIALHVCGFYTAATVVKLGLDIWRELCYPAGVPAVVAAESVSTSSLRARKRGAAKIMTRGEFKRWKSAHLLLIAHEALYQRTMGTCTAVERAGVAMQMHSIIRRLRGNANDPLVAAARLSPRQVIRIVSMRTEYSNSVVELASALAFVPHSEIEDLIRSARESGTFKGNF